MSTDNRDQLVDQLLRGVYRLCVDREQCPGCPFFYSKCLMGEPKPKEWFDADTILTEPVIEEPAMETVTEPVKETASETNEPAPAPIHIPAPVSPSAPAAPAVDDDSDGTWIVSASMGSVFTKYVYICSKCGYKKESVFSLTPMNSCPECEKRKAEKKNLG